MAFPTIPTAGASTLLSATTTTATTTHTFPNLTTLAPAAGDLIIAIICQYEGDTNPQFSSWGASLNEILDDSLTGTGNGAVGVAHKTATGSESGTFTVTSVNSFRSVQFLMRIPADTWHGTTAPEVAAATRAAGDAADPPSLDPSNWGVEDTLWICAFAHTETSTTGSPPTLTASPANFSDDLIVARAADAVGHITAGVGFRQNAAVYEDPGVYTGTNLTRGSGVATVIAVRPAAEPEAGPIRRIHMVPSFAAIQRAGNW